MCFYPENYSSLAEYHTLIQGCDTKYVWHKVYMYDVQFRAKLATALPGERFAFHSVDVGLFVTILDATAVKSQNGCYRCCSLSHNVANCPKAFQTSHATLETSKKERKGQPFEKWHHQGVEGLNNWQAGKCHFSSCAHAHVCRQCRGPQPLYMCDRCKHREKDYRDQASFYCPTGGPYQNPASRH